MLITMPIIKIIKALTNHRSQVISHNSRIKSTTTIIIILKFFLILVMFKEFKTTIAT